MMLINPSFGTLATSGITHRRSEFVVKSLRWLAARFGRSRNGATVEASSRRPRGLRVRSGVAAGEMGLTAINHNAIPMTRAGLARSGPSKSSQWLSLGERRR